MLYICDKCGFESDLFFCPCSINTYNSLDGLAGYSSATIDDFPIDSVKVIIRTLRDKYTIALFGPSGTGKTHLAIAIAKFFKIYGRRYRLIGPEFNKEESDYAKRADFLIIDEVCDAHLHILTYRIQEKLMTICTTNENLDSNCIGLNNRFVWRLKNKFLINTYTPQEIIDEKKEFKELELKRWKKFIDEPAYVDDFEYLSQKEEELTI